MPRRKPILVLSDLANRSDHAVAFGAALAHLLSAGLHMVHAMGLKYRPLRTVISALNNLDAAQQAAADAMQVQLRRAAPRFHGTLAPMVDLDDAVRAIERRTEQVSPMVVVTPPLWAWGSRADHPHTLSTASLSRFSCPLIIVREARGTTYNRVVVISDPDALPGEALEAAERWAFWLERIKADRNAAPGGPQFEVWRLGGKQPAIHDRTDLIVVSANALLNAALVAELNGVMPDLLARSVAPIVLIPPRARSLYGRSSETLPLQRAYKSRLADSPPVLLGPRHD